MKSTIVTFSIVEKSVFQVDFNYAQPDELYLITDYQ